MFATTTLAGAEPTVEVGYPPVPIPSHPVTQTTVVQPGDHLWKISSEHLAEMLERSPTNSEIGPHWLLTIEKNRETLKSGDPDLIFPGEVLALPQTPSDSP